MENGSEKDAARSKWRQTQRHKRGRGGDRGGRGGGRHHLGSPHRHLDGNLDRYLEEEDFARGEGPVRKSQGADLAELLSQAGSYDAGFYSRQRANLAEEYGLPPADAASYPGLSLDLDGLAACLATLPLQEVLGLSEPVGSSAQQQMSQQPGGSGAAGVRLGESATGPSSGAAAQQPNSQPAALGHEAAGPGAERAAALQAAPLVVGHEAKLEKLEVQIMEPAGPRPSAEDTSVPHSDAGAVPSGERELDFLLGLDAKPALNAGKAASAAVCGAGAEESLEDWLDSL